VKVGEYVLEEDEAEVVYESKGSFNSMSNKGVVVALDTEITEELSEEGIARDIVRIIQEMRKEADYQVDDRIKLYIETTDKIKGIVEKWQDYVKKETLAEELSFDGAKEADIEKESKMEDGNVKIELLK